MLIPKGVFFMPVKVKRLIIIYTAAALVALSAVAAVSHVRLKDYRLAAQYSSERAFEAAVASADGMSRALKKLSYATDDELGRSICSEAYANALTAEAAISVLPFETVELEKLSGFINRAGDYTESLCAQSQDELSTEQREHLRTISDAAADLAKCLRELQSSLNDGSVMMDSREELLQNIGTDNTEKISARLMNYENTLSPAEEFAYDGKYSPTEKKPAGELNEEEARALAAKAAGVEERELKDEYSFEGSDSRRCYSYGELMLCVSSRGLESMAQSRLVSEGRIDPEKAGEIAENFLRAQGFEDLTRDMQSGSDAIAVFRYVPTQDGAVRPDDYISVSIALDDGSIYAFDATRYTEEKADVNWKTDEEAAADTLPESISAESSRKVIIKSPGGRYLPCYELSCTDDEGASVRVYVNAEDGKQCRIDL